MTTIAPTAPKIHHATAAKAEKLGVTLAYDTKAQAMLLKAGSRRMWHPEDAKALLEAYCAIDAFEKANPLVRINQKAPAPGEAYFEAVYATARNIVIASDPDLADLLETLNEQVEDGSIEENRPQASGGVVPSKYKQRYAENGDPTTCGDWLALLLNQYCQVQEGKKTITDLDRVEAIAIANGVEATRVDRLGTQTNGWQGRYRMTVRNMLTKVVASKGEILIPEGIEKEDTTIPAPADWMHEHAPKAKSPKKEVAAQ